MAEREDTGAGEFEFSAEHERVIDKLARRARVWGAISTAGGALSLVAAAALASRVHEGAPRATTFIFAALPQLSVGLSFLGAGRVLGAVVTTHGHDITLLLDAMKRFTLALRVQILATVLFVLTAVALAWAAMALGGEL